ncbi:uncharacterized protein BYT42DRAFT_546437 [Radiomyces spectabilis]|uniref:uncharacterized protein n=1 Tax=Radiomyces spectabilis TaxID=64574 RepID=UPI00222051EA|nr:uncharacterized protein BYT42DRAFT_546437 [Radiomyces spectabilis]KAI8377807.1 hypothetical protein BYT42DRAFT_546437 [Radiomyces spectabilis]
MKKKYPDELKSDPVRGRGVFATKPIPRNALVDISPILLFPHDEYRAHGQFTVADHYTYRWKNGYALALGLGSMFNHANDPNVGFVRDFDNSLIRYITLRDIAPDEELCISYGANLWFVNTEDADNTGSKDISQMDTDEEEDNDGSWLQTFMLDDD